MNVLKRSFIKIALMANRRLFVAMLSLFFISMGFAAPIKAKVIVADGYIIQGSTNQKTGTIAKLFYKIGEKEHVDSTKVVNGKFVIRGHVADPVAAYINVGKPDMNQFVSLVLENKKITVAFSSEMNPVVKGSPLSDQYEDYNKAYNVLRDKAGVIYQKLDGFFKAEGKEQTRTATLNPEHQKIIDDEFAQLNKEGDSINAIYIKKYANSIVSAQIILDHYIGWSTSDVIKRNYDLLSDEVKGSIQGKAIGKHLEAEAKTAIGVIAADFTMNDVDGKPVTLSSLRGKYVLLDFWASWCAPCRKENPNVVIAYNDFHSKGFDIVQVSLDDKKDAWLAAIKKDGLTWTHLSDLKGWNNAAARLYNVKAVPTNILIDGTGKIIAKNLRGEELQAKLKELFK
jgi:peroxiredoxin